MELTLSEELFLMSRDAQGRRAGNPQRLDVALAGGWLLDLALLQRVDVPDKRVDVVDTTWTGHPQLDMMLDTLSRRRRRKAQRWILELRRKASQETAYQLQRIGVVQEREHRVLGLFPVKRYHPSGSYSTEPGRARLHQVLAGAQPDARSVALGTLIYAAKLDRNLLAGVPVPRREAKKRLRDLTQEVGISDAVRRAVQSIESATVAAGASAGGDGGGGGGGGG